MTTTIQMETVKDEKGNITEVFDTSRGKITAEIANPDRRIITERRASDDRGKEL